MKYHFPFGRASGATLLLIATMGLIESSCTKEKVDCGQSIPNGIIRFQLVDDRTGLEWFMPPRPFSLDTLRKLNDQYFTQTGNGLIWSGISLANDYALPNAGGDKTATYFIRLNSKDTDTIQVHTFFGPVSESSCGYRYAQSVQVRYNGKPNGSYDSNQAGGFYCSGCGPILTFRKRP